MVLIKGDVSLCDRFFTDSKVDNNWCICGLVGHGREGTGSCRHKLTLALITNWRRREINGPNRWLAKCKMKNNLVETKLQTRDPRRPHSQGLKLGCNHQITSYAYSFHYLIHASTILGKFLGLCIHLMWVFVSNQRNLCRHPSSVIFFFFGPFISYLGY